MKPACFPVLLALLLIPVPGRTQALPTPCDLQVWITSGICFDIPCIPFYGNQTGGTQPYQYQWSNGSIGSQTTLFLPPAPFHMDTCFTLTVTDAAGCVAVASARYTDQPISFFQVDSTFLSNDSLNLPHAGGSFDLGANDHVFAQNYMVVQPPKHGAVVLNADGTGTYTPAPNWCGPDYFRYTATDTSGCWYGRMTTVWIEQYPCAGILPVKPDCNQSCNGSAVVYQNAVLLPPLTYLWSNGSTGAEAGNLCEGPVSVTVTDGAGAVQEYSGTIDGSMLQATITGPTQVCNGTQITLSAGITAQNSPNYQFSWSGPGIYASLQFGAVTKPYCSTQTDTAVYNLHVLAENGCSVTGTLSIDVHPALSGDVSVELPQCPGDTLEIRPNIVNPGTPPYTYSWSGPAGVQSNWPELIWPDVSAAHAGTYTVTVTDVNGCSIVRKKDVNIPDTCSRSVTILNKGTTYCSGSDLPLRFGMTPSWVIPERYEWTGPNGFVSSDLQPTRTNAQPDMTGWYYFTAQFGSTVRIDSAHFTVAPDALYFTSVSTSPPTDCVAPFDGNITLEMNAPPPYQVRFTDIGQTQYNTNPIVRNTMRDGFNEVKVVKYGCTAFKNLYVESPKPPQVLVQEESCAGNDAALTVSAPNPVSVTWTLPNGNTVSNKKDLINVGPGRYLFFAKDDSTKCTFRDTLYLSPYLGFRFSVLDTPTCTSADGSLLALPIGNPVPPLAFDWSNGQNGNPIAGLAPGGYSLTVTDGDGCNRHRNTVMGPKDACIAQVTGRVYVNTSCNCSLGGNTVVFPFAKVCATNGSYTTCSYTDNTGAYVLALTDPGQYTITATTYVPTAQGSCTEFQYTVGPDVTKDTSGVNFFFCGAAQSDLQTTLNCGAARPGFAHEASVMVRNNGIWPADTSLLTVLLSPYLTSPYFSPQPQSYDPATRTALWQIPKLALYQQFLVEIQGTIAANLGDTLQMEADVVSLYTPDTYLANNAGACSTIVTGSYDPNDKLVNPVGVGASGHISPADSVLTYTIRFQNTGTDTAFTVVVRDTLDAAVFDVGSVAPLLSSHPYRLFVENGHILVFVFDPILLPDSSRSQDGSNGFVMFSIHLRNNLPEGTRIANSAAIYFDYNAPIITNSAQNTLVQVDDAAPEVLPSVSLRPNPATDQTTLIIGQEAALTWIDISLYSPERSVFRHLLHSANPSGGLSLPINTRTLPTGMYYVVIRSNLGQVTKKLLVFSE